MKLKTKKSLYICGYLSLMAIPMLLAAFDYYKSLNMHLTLLLNPLIFIIYDTLIMLFLFKRLKQEEYILQERVIRYFKILNFILFIFLFLAYPNFLSLLDIVLHVIVFFIIRPIPVPDRENGVEEFFNKYPERSKHRFFKDVNEIKREYNPLKKEIETEIPIMMVEEKDQKKYQRKKVLTNVLLIALVICVLLGGVLATIEANKKFNRGLYHYFSASINDDVVPLYYDQSYEKTIVPFIYKQNGSMNNFTAYEIGDKSIRVDVAKQDHYVLNLREYTCHDGKTKVPCNFTTVNNKREIELNDSQMSIYYVGEDVNFNFQHVMTMDEDKAIYSGVYHNDITSYINDLGVYAIKVINESDNITNIIVMLINITEEKMIEN